MEEGGGAGYKRGVMREEVEELQTHVQGCLSNYSDKGVGVAVEYNQGDGKSPEVSEISSTVKRKTPLSFESFVKSRCP
jgi:hypothetical protein